MFADNTGLRMCVLHKVHGYLPFLFSCMSLPRTLGSTVLRQTLMAVGSNVKTEPNTCSKSKRSGQRNSCIQQHKRSMRQYTAHTVYIYCLWNEYKCQQECVCDRAASINGESIHTTSATPSSESIKEQTHTTHMGVSMYKIQTYE